MPFALGEGERSRRAGGERDLDLRRVGSFLEAGDEEDEEEEDEESDSDSDEEEEEEEELSSLPSLKARCKYAQTCLKCTVSSSS